MEGEEGGIADLDLGIGLEEDGSDRLHLDCSISGLDRRDNALPQVVVLKALPWGIWRLVGVSSVYG